MVKYYIELKLWKVMVILFTINPMVMSSMREPIHMKEQQEQGTRPLHSLGTGKKRRGGTRRKERETTGLPSEAALPQSVCLSLQGESLLLLRSWGRLRRRSLLVTWSTRQLSLGGVHWIKQTPKVKSNCHSWVWQWWLPCLCWRKGKWWHMYEIQCPIWIGVWTVSRHRQVCLHWLK